MEETRNSEPKNADIARTLPQSTGLCGISAFQRAATLRMFTVNLAVLYLVQIAVMTYVAGSYRTLEKRFNLSSRQVGTLNAVNDAVQVVSVVFVGYFARKAHKPRVMSVSVLFFALGAVLYAMPYFIYGSKEGMTIESSRLHGRNGTRDGDFCTEGGLDAGTSCEEETLESDRNYAAYSLITLAQVSIGIGGSCIRVMGFTYIDENVNSKDTPLYIGLAGVVIPIGPILGFLLAAVCASLPENLRSSHLDPTEPGYIGAWWLGFLVIGAMVVVSAVPMYFFPKHFAEYYTQKHSRQSLGGRQGAPPDTRTRVRTELQGFVRGLYRMCTNVTLVMFTLSSVFDIWVMIGMAGNLTRYLEIQFRLDAFKANIITAVSVAVPGMFGSIVSGAFMKRKKVSVQGAALMHTATCAYVAVTLAIYMGLGCPQEDIAGTNLDHDHRLSVHTTCNTECRCSLNSMRPVCATSGVNYLSPCHAGCKSMTNQTYLACSCVVGNAQSAVSGLCWQECKTLVPYIFLMTLASFVISVGRVPSVVINLRVVDPELRSFSLGIVSFASNLLGFIPAPIAFGALVDSACLVWQHSCGMSGACFVYDKAIYRVSLYGSCLGFQCLALLFSTVAWALIRRDTTLGKYTDVDGVACEELGEFNGITNQCFQDDSDALVQTCPNLKSPVDSQNTNEATAGLVCEVNERVSQFLDAADSSLALSYLHADGELEEDFTLLEHGSFIFDDESASLPAGQEPDTIVQAASEYAVSIINKTHEYAMALIKATTDFTIGLNAGSLKSKKASFSEVTINDEKEHSLGGTEWNDNAFIDNNLESVENPAARSDNIGVVRLNKTTVPSSEGEIGSVAGDVIISRDGPCPNMADVAGNIPPKDQVGIIDIKYDAFQPNISKAMIQCAEIYCKSITYLKGQDETKTNREGQEHVGETDLELEAKDQQTKTPCLEFCNELKPEVEDILDGSFLWDMLTLEDVAAGSSVA